MLGMPTSRDIALKAEKISAAKEKAAREQEALSAAKKYTADSLAALEALRNASCMLKMRSELRVTIMTEPEAKYSIVAGAFASEANADKLCKTIEEAGFRAVKLTYRSGLTAVAVEPGNDIVVIASKYAQLLERNLIPQEAWILIDE